MLVSPSLSKKGMEVQDWTFFTVIQQIIVVLTIMAQLIVAYNVVNDAHGGEQLVRGLAISTGVLIFLGSYALKITFADMIFISITDAGLLKTITVGVIMPVLVGFCVSELAITVISSGGNFAVRMMLMCGVFITVQIAYLNYMAISQVSMPYEKALIPNLCYAIAMGLWSIFRYESKGQSQYSRY